MKRIYLSKELLTYIITGGITTGVNYMLYGLFLFFHVPYIASNSIAWTGAVIAAYVLNRKWVFRSNRRIPEEFSPLLLYDLSHCSSKTFCFGLPSINYHFFDRLKINRKRRNRDRKLCALQIPRFKTAAHGQDQNMIRRSCCHMTIKNNPADDVISIIVPCFNEESVLPAFYSAVSDAASSIEGAVCEFLFIDDGSSDRTAEILQHFTEKDERVRFLTFSRNFGKEAAMYAGLQNASGDYCVFMDADLQHPPALLKNMYHAVKYEGYDCCAGLREDRTGEIRSARSYPALSIT